MVPYGLRLLAILRAAAPPLTPLLPRAAQRSFAMPKKGGGGKHDEVKEEEKLQAVVIAMGFELSEAWKPLRCVVGCRPPAVQLKQLLPCLMSLAHR